MERIDYDIVINDYINGEKYIHSTHLSFLNALLSMEDILYKYIEDKNGVGNIFIYIKNVMPEFRGKNFNFIQYYSINKAYAKNCSRIYGVFFNATEITKNLRIEIVKHRKTFHIKPRNHKKYAMSNVYSEVLDELKKVMANNIIDKSED